MNPPRANRKLLNPAVLTNIVSTTVEKQLSSTGSGTNVGGFYVTDKRSMEIFKKKLEECECAVLWKNVVSLFGPNLAKIGQLEPTTFTALLEHSRIAIPKVVLDVDFGDMSSLKTTGIEWLKFVGTAHFSSRLDVDQMVRIMDENKYSLKKVLQVPEALFGRLPGGLVIDVFSPSSLVKPCDIKVPSLDTKVFKYELDDKKTKIPLNFVVNVNADEIQLQIDQLHQLHLQSSRPATNCEGHPDVTTNRRIKKMRLEFIGEQASYLDFGRVFRQLAEYCPRLERLELVHAKHFYEGWGKAGYHYVDIVRAVDKLVAAFENALLDAEAVSYEVYLQTHCWYYYDKEELLPEETDFECGLLKTDPPLSLAVPRASTEHSYFVKEVSMGRGNLRVNCEIIKGTKRSEESYFDNIELAALSE